jgi:N utilization substance protein B
MINRILLRIKIVQIVYSYYKNEKKTEVAVENELFFSIEQTYNLYNFLLLLAVEITNHAQNRIDIGKKKLRPTPEDLNPNVRFIENSFIKQLASNVQLNKYIEEKKISWKDHPEVLKSIYEEIVTADYFTEYMQAETSSYKEDKDIWRKIFKKTILQNKELETTLEDINLYWNDDIDIVISFILKTIKQFDEENAQDQALQPMFKDADDRKFAKELLCETISDSKKYRELIDEHTKNWEIDRIAFMDIVIMQIALAELHNFPAIPVNVTLNEYIEIAKTYSTERSSTFINGVLDNIVNKLRKDNKITKIAFYVPNQK